MSQYETLRDLFLDSTRTADKAKAQVRGLERDIVRLRGTLASLEAELPLAEREYAEAVGIMREIWSLTRAEIEAWPTTPPEETSDGRTD